MVISVVTVGFNSSRTCLHLPFVPIIFFKKKLQKFSAKKYREFVDTSVVAHC